MSPWSGTSSTLKKMRGKKYLHRHKHISWVRSDYCNTQDKSQTRHVKRICKSKKGPFLAALSREHVRHRAHRLSVVCSDYPSPQVFLKPVRRKLATRKHLAFTIHLQKPLHKGLLSLHLGTPAWPSFLRYSWTGVPFPAFQEPKTAAVQGNQLGYHH